MSEMLERDREREGERERERAREGGREGNVGNCPRSALKEFSVLGIMLCPAICI